MKLKPDWWLYFFIFRQNTFSLVEGGYATIIFMETAKSNNITVHEIYVVYFKDDNTSNNQYLLYSSISGKILRLAGGINMINMK